MSVQRFDLGDGRELLWTQTGAPDGPPAIVIPGLSDGLAPLSEPPSRRVLPDPPPDLGHLRVLVVSHRHPIDPEPTTASLAEDVRRFLEVTVDEPVVVSGHSMGGMVAQHLAARHPALVSRLVLSATAGRADDRLRSRLEHWDELLEAGRWRAFSADAMRASYTGAEMLRRWLLLHVSVPPRLPHLVARHHALSFACRHHDATPVLRAISAPTLLVAGARDELIAGQRTRELAAAIPDCRLHVLERAGHGLAEQEPERYVRLLARFLAETDGARRGQG